MENVVMHSSLNSIQAFIMSLKKNYYISIDNADNIKFFSAKGNLLDYYITDSFYLKHTPIEPTYSVVKNIKSSYVIKVSIPSFSIIFPQYNNLSYTFNESSIDIILKLPNNSISLYNIEDFFDNGIRNYLKRTLDGIFMRNFIGSNSCSLCCEDYHCIIKPLSKENDYTSL